MSESVKKIGIDVRVLAGKRTGKANHLHYLLTALFSFDTKTQYVLYTKDDLQGYTFPSNVTVKKIKIPMPFWHVFCWFDFTFREKVDIFLATTSYIIPSFSKQCVIVVHDLVSFLNITTHDKKAEWIEKMTLKSALKKSRHIISVSKNTKEDLIKLFSVPDKKITVIHEGIDPVFYEPVFVGEIEKVRTQYELPKEYLLFVSTLEPRKNILNILKSYEQLKQENPNAPDLVMAGKKGWGTDDFYLYLKTMKSTDAVHLPGHIDANDLPALYQGACLYLFPVLYEGFGLTVLEALASGLPVVTSHVSSIPEIAGSAARYVDPKKPEDIADTVEQILKDGMVSSELSAKATKQASQFDVNVMAQKTREVLEEYAF
ncbi:glycosyltransferase family 4 protein [Patescibacteria group bacterium]|nr:glycosyltransferase family 4 protein [Patescibacteria group bacterium]